MKNAEAAAAALLAARTGHARMPALPEPMRPSTVDDGYAIQRAFRPLFAAGAGGPQIGWKIGCTNETAQRHIGVDEPFYGGIFQATTQLSPARVSAARHFMTVIEAEIAFRLGDDLPAAAAPYDPDTVAEAVDACAPAVEIVDSRYEDWTTIGAPHIVADNGSHGAWVRGAAVGDWRGIDLAELEVVLRCNGAAVREGSGANVMEHPVNALTWLANVRAVYAREGLRKGDWVSTGTTIIVYPAKVGDRLVAEFGTLGQVELEIVE
ncbi:MAG: fumarylacetoacetate hydrolase family protein [Pseudomonadota bacterium]|nr:fumarylacetoacetate hydrolase family protein [Pseudomonadota bacterium]